MAIRGEEGKYSLFVRHEYFLSPQQLLSNFLNFPSITPNDDPLVEGEGCDSWIWAWFPADL
jgi:hypothetical protein